MKADRLLLLLLTFSALFPLSIKPLLAGEFDPLSTTELNRALNLAVPANTLASTRTAASNPAATSLVNAVPATETLLVERHINQKGQSGRLADVYTYDYAQNETVFSVVDLTTNKVLSTERKQKLQLPLTANELKRATDLVFTDSEERRLLNNEYKRITGNELKSVSQLNVKAFVFDADSLPERLNPASKECGLHRCARGVVDMDDTAVTMPPFARQMIFAVFTGKGHPAIDQPLHRFGGMLDRETRRHRIIQIRTGVQGVRDMVFNRIGAVEDCGNAALSPAGCRIGDGAFADQAHLQAGIRQ